MALVDATNWASLMTDDRPARFGQAETTVTKALSLAPNHAMAHMLLGVVQMFTNRAAQGIAECEQALALDRNLASAHALIGLAKFFLAEARKPKLMSTRRSASLLAILTPIAGCMFVGIAKLQLGADEAAVVWLRRGLEANRNYPLAHFQLAAALARAGSSWMRRGPLHRRDLRSIRASPSAASASADARSTIRPTSLGASASLRACGWPGCRKGEDCRAPHVRPYGSQPTPRRSLRSGCRRLQPPHGR